MTETVFYVVAFICSILLAFTLTPPVRVLAFRIGAVDVPLDGRRIHKKPIPRIGGLAIYLSFLLTTALFCDITRELVTIWLGGAIIVMVGVIDDIFRINALIKLAAQIVAAVFAVSNGCVIDHINIGGAYIMLGYFSIPISLLWIVGLTNAINLIDGLDGLACGVSAISSFSLMLVVLLHGDMLSTLLCLVLLGACLGFLPFNSNPAKIFMGDTGALFLGYTMAVLSVHGVFKMHAILSFLAPLVIFGLPLFDTLFSIIRRVLQGKSPFAPDRGHIHHRLIDMGFSQKEAVYILYAICGILGLVAVFTTESMFAFPGRIIKSIALVIIAIALFAVNFMIMKNPAMRKHSGISEDDITVSEYMDELGPEKARKMEKHNGGHAAKAEANDSEANDAEANNTEAENTEETEEKDVRENDEADTGDKQ